MGHVSPSPFSIAIPDNSQGEELSNVLQSALPEGERLTRDVALQALYSMRRRNNILANLTSPFLARTVSLLLTGGISIAALFGSGYLLVSWGAGQNLLELCLLIVAAAGTIFVATFTLFVGDAAESLSSDFSAAAALAEEYIVLLEDEDDNVPVELRGLSMQNTLFDHLSFSPYVGLDYPSAP